MPGFDILSKPSSYCSARIGLEPKIFVVHCVGVPLSQVFHTLDAHQVSAHFFIPQVSGAELQNLMPEEFGNCTLRYPNQVPVVQMVDPKQQAWHAGASSFAKFNALPGCNHSLNDCSIGIEFHSPGYDDKTQYKFGTYTSKQINIGIALIKQLANAYNIPHTHCFAHSTISPMRKTDPGPGFSWQELQANGIGYLPPHKPIVDHQHASSDQDYQFVSAKLRAIGFSCAINASREEVMGYTDAYIMQFASHLWRPPHHDISPSLIDSLSNFDHSIFSL